MEGYAVIYADLLVLMESARFSFTGVFSYAEASGW